MLNVKYLLFEEDNQQKVVKNHTALGNAWTIDSLKLVSSADKLLLQMKKLDFSNQALFLKNEAPQNIPYGFQW